MTATLPNTNDLLEWALYYCARGWSVIPVNPRTKKPCLKMWKRYQTERPTEPDLRRWFSGKHKALGVVLGAVSGNLGTLDFDSQERYDWWQRTHPELARTLPTEQTARPGYHVLFICEPIPTQKPKGQEIELLCEGAYVILTPSPGKRWLIPPNGEIPKIDPFSLSLEAFGIKKPEPEMTQFTEETEETEEPEETEIASVSSLSSVNLELVSDEVQERLDEAITKTLPTRVGERDRSIFTFCQWVKAIPELRSCSAAQLKPIVQRWHARAYPVIGTKPFETTWKDFVYAWKRVRWSKGRLLSGVLQEAVENTATPPEAAHYEDRRTQFLVRICWQLQRLHGDQPFYLALRTAGKLLDLSHTEAGKRLEMLVADGILAIVAPHTNIFATRYRYVGHKRGTSQ